MFHSLFFYLFGKLCAVERMYELHLVGDIFHLVGLQLTDKVPTIGGIVLCGEFLHAVFPEHEIGSDAHEFLHGLPSLHLDRRDDGDLSAARRDRLSDLFEMFGVDHAPTPPLRTYLPWRGRKT